MFDVQRTGREIADIYQHILHGSSRPADFDSATYVDRLRPVECVPTSKTDFQMAGAEAV